MEKKEKKNLGKKEKAPPEKFWNELVKVYYAFYMDHFRDNDGYKLSPGWTAQTRGMESAGLKGIIVRLRTIAEAKNIDWTLEQAQSDVWNFLLKAYHNFAFIKKNMMCCLMNKYKDQIIVSELHFSLSKKILSHWYELFPDKKDSDRDIKGSEIIIGYLKQQYLQNGLVFNEASVLGTIRTIFHHIQQDEFWSKKSLVSVGYNISEFVIKIKSQKNGANQTLSREGLATEFNRRYK
jgi:hypothetical protein